MSKADWPALGDLIAQLYIRNSEAAGVRVGVVGLKPLVGPVLFGEVLVQNRGAIIKVFTDVNEVLEWLGVELEEE